MAIQMKATEQCFPMEPYDYTVQGGNPKGLCLKQGTRKIREVCTNLEGIVPVPNNMIIRETGD